MFGVLGASVPPAGPSTSSLAPRGVGHASTADRERDPLSRSMGFVLRGFRGRWKAATLSTPGVPVYVDVEAKKPMSAAGGGISKEDLGRATWTFLHTLAAQYPERPTGRQQKDARELVYILTRLYPCADCAKHWEQLVRDFPPRVSSGPEFRQWMCEAHNIVNRSIGKPAFNCDFVESRWGAVECQESLCDLRGRH